MTEPSKTIDVDTTWNPKEMSLDDHRQKEFATLKENGFGEQAKKNEPAPLVPDVEHNTQYEGE